MKQGVVDKTMPKPTQTFAGKNKVFRSKGKRRKRKVEA